MRGGGEVRVPGWYLDVATVAVLLALTITLEQTYLVENVKIAGYVGGHAAWTRMDLWWWSATALGAAALLVRRVVPLVALAVTAAMAVVHIRWTVIIPGTPVDLAVPVALYTVAATTRRRLVSYAALAVVLAVAVPLTYTYRSPLGSWGGPLLPAAVLTLGWFIGENTRTRRAYLTGIEGHARDLERERDQQAEIATAAERARIARELHDAVAHALAVIVLQAQAATSSLRTRPERAEQALAAITSSGRAAMAEVRRLLGMYRPDPEDPNLAPLPSLADLPELVDRVRAAGLPVEAVVAGPVENLPTGVGLSAYRITQEALTNALKHAGPTATATVTVHCRPDAVEVSVTDTGPGALGGPDERRGNGLRGMRERVGMLGGTLSIGAGPDGRFRVHAQLPIGTP
jgi:signal transduction histidine kinase